MAFLDDVALYGLAALGALVALAYAVGKAVNFWCWLNGDRSKW